MIFFSAQRNLEEFLSEFLLRNSWRIPNWEKNDSECFMNSIGIFKEFFQSFQESFKNFDVGKQFDVQNEEWIQLQSVVTIWLENWRNIRFQISCTAFKKKWKLNSKTSFRKGILRSSINLSLVSKGNSWRPRPRLTTQCNFSFGHNLLASCIPII